MSPFLELSGVSKQFGGELRPGLQLATYYYYLNNSDAALKDKRVRQALSMVIDRDVLTSKLTQAGEKPMYGLMPNGTKGAQPFTPPDTLASHTVKLGFLLGGHEGASPAIAYQILDFDRAGRYSLDGQVTLHGLAGALSARLTTTSSVGIELPVFHGPVKPKPFLLLHVVL